MNDITQIHVNKLKLQKSFSKATDLRYIAGVHN